MSMKRVLLCGSRGHLVAGRAYRVRARFRGEDAPITTYSEYAATASAGAMLDPDTHQAHQPAFAIALMVLYVVVLTGIAVSVERRRDVA
jgi:hypothetical protein